MDQQNIARKLQEKFQAKNSSILSIVFSTMTTLLCLTLITFSSCQVNDYSIEKKITESDINRFQTKWSLSIVGIGSAFSNQQDYNSLARQHVDEFYALDHSKILLRKKTNDTLQVKTTFESVMEFLVSSESEGFALTPWKDIKWTTEGIINDAGKMALTMGQYTFIDYNDNQCVFDYTIAFERNKEDQIMIIAYDIHELCEER